MAGQVTRDRASFYMLGNKTRKHSKLGPGCVFVEVCLWPDIMKTGLRSLKCQTGSYGSSVWRTPGGVWA